MMVQITKAFYDADEDPESAITVLTGMFPKILRVWRFVNSSQDSNVQKSLIILGNGKLFTAGADFSAEAMMGGGMQDKYRNSKKKSEILGRKRGITRISSIGLTL